jgi:decaprenylphospho-beta-D-ribofuranose 2-oxidase
MPQAEPESAALRQARFVSFDGGVSLQAWQQRPDRYRHLEADFGTRPRIARGGGYSYAAASFGDGVLVQHMGAFDRLLEFDGRERLRVEAGATVESVVNWAAQRSLYLPVLPGYPRITIGGCIAADVHGKNSPRDGTFSDWVEAFTLFRPGRGFAAVSRDSDPDLFEATCGGFGLTGTVVDATLRLERRPALAVSLRRTRCGLQRALEALREPGSADFAYSWHDGTRRGAAFGGGLLVQGSWSDAPAPSGPGSYRPITADDRGRWRLNAWNRATTTAANALIARAAWSGTRTQGTFETAFPLARRGLYYRLFGRAGLAEAQILVPDAALATLQGELARLVGRLDPPLVMMSAKRFRGRQRSLSPSGEGTLLALNLVRSARTGTFLAALDALTADTGSQPNVAKDSRLPAAVAARTLPGYGLFRERIARIDPQRLHQSELSRRLGL